MATVSEYISAKLAQFGFEISEPELEFLALKMDLELFSAMSKSAIENVEKAMITLIPELLAVPNVSDNGTSITKNIEGIKAYHSKLCAEYGLENSLEPKIRDASSIW